MNPTVFAMRRPVTTLMLVVAMISGGILAYNRMRVDIFPSLNVPKIYVFLDYIGMSPDQMEGFIVNQLELYFQYVDGIQDINTRNIQQVALCELSFFPGTDMGQAMAQVVAMSDRAMSWMPKGTLPPMIMRMDAGSVPVGYLVFESEQTSLGAMGDLAQNVVRPLVQKFVPGTVAISPFGPNMRAIVINVDPHKLLDYNVTPQQVSDALAKGNRIIPAGNIYIKDSMPVVSNNATVVDIKHLGDIPLKLGLNVYLRDVATFHDDTDITYGYALVNGKKSVYLPIIKKDTGSTLTVVADVRKSMQLFRDAVPKDVSVNFEFDESPTVVAAVESVATEGLIGAGLTGLMILLFLRDWRSVVVVVVTIPLALLGSLFGLWVTGNTINIMSLGGLALAIGILVDMATVTIENVNVQMARTPKIATAVLHGSLTTAVPILLALLCILSVFVPAFIMADPLRSLFMPLTLAVGFAMIAAYMLSSTFVPVLCVKLLRHVGHHDDQRGLFARFLKGYRKAVGWFVRLRWVVVPAYLAVCGVILWLLGTQIGTELFPQIDSGQFVLRFRPPPGSNFELTREMAVKCLEEIEREAKPENIQITMGFVGQVAPNFGIDNMVLFMRGPDDGQLRVALRGESGIKLDEFRERLRKVLPERVVPWLAQRLEQGGLPRAEAQRQAKTASFGFQPGDIVTKRHELRLADANCRSGRRHRSEAGPAACREDFRRDETHPVSPRRPVRPDARLSLHRGRDRSREGGAKRCQRRGRGSRTGHGDGIDPVRQPQLLGRRENRFRLPGPDSDPAPPDGEAGRRRDLAARVGQPPGQPDDPRRGQGPKGRAARRDRSRHVAALRDARSRMSRARTWAGRRGRSAEAIARRRGAAPRRAGRAHGPAAADDRDVQVAGYRPGGRRVRDLRALDGLLPVGAAGIDLGRRRAGSARRHRHDPLLHAHLAEHRVVHGLDHVPGRLGLELGAARDLHGRVLEGRGVLDRRRPSSARATGCGRS